MPCPASVPRVIVGCQRLTSKGENAKPVALVTLVSMNVESLVPSPFTSKARKSVPDSFKAITRPVLVIANRTRDMVPP